MCEPRHPFAVTASRDTSDDDMIELSFFRDCVYEELRKLHTYSLFNRDVFNVHIKHRLRYRDLISVRSTCKSLHRLISHDWIAKNRFIQFFPSQVNEIHNLKDPRPMFMKNVESDGMDNFAKYIIDGDIQSAIKLLDSCKENIDKLRLITGIKDLNTLYHNAIHYDPRNELRNKFLFVLHEWYKTVIQPSQFFNIQDQHGRTYLHWVTFFNDVSKLDELLNNSSQFPYDIVNHQSTNGETALHIAASLGHVTAVEHLLQCKAKVFIETKTGKLPITYAVANGHYNVVKYFLQYQPSLMETFYERCRFLTAYNLVYMAAFHGYDDILRILIQHKADIHYSKKFKIGSPLFLAAQNGHASTVRLLLASGADTLETTIISREQILDFMKYESIASQERLNEFLASQPANLERICMTAFDIAFVMGHDKISNEILGTRQFRLD